MNTFATFVLLSVTKFTIVSVNELAYTDLRDINGTLVAKAPVTQNILVSNTSHMLFLR